jgi:hypothetical protein
MTQLLIKKKRREKRRRKEKKRNFNNVSKKNSFSKLHSVRVPKTELYPRSMEKDYLYMTQLLIKKKRREKRRRKEKKRNFNNVSKKIPFPNFTLSGSPKLSYTLGVWKRTIYI